MSFEFLSNAGADCIRAAACLCFTAASLSTKLPARILILVAISAGVGEALMGMLSLPILAILTFETVITAISIWWWVRSQLQTTLFLIIFYEMAVAVWDYIADAAILLLPVLSESSVSRLPLGMWIVRSVLLTFAVLVYRRDGLPTRTIEQLSDIASIGAFFSVLILSNLPVYRDDSEMISWIILAIVLVTRTVAWRMRRAHERDQEMARLKLQQAVEREADHQQLKKLYTANATLYHDLHNHLRILRTYFSNGQNAEGLEYIDALEAPASEIAARQYARDPGLSALISSKVSVAETRGIAFQTDTDWPIGTNLETADLASILGNLLDNALEGVQIAGDSEPFIRLTVRSVSETLILRVENSARDPEKARKSSKPADANHGWGLRSVQRIAQRYNGTLMTGFLDGTFRAVVTLSYSKI